MNRTFRTVSAFVRHQWCIEPVFAEQHLPLINSYLSGQLPLKTFSDEDDEDDDSEENAVSRVGYAVAINANQSASATPKTRYALDDPELPEGSVFVLDIRGTILKESTCCSYGTEEYCSMLEAAYANDKIIGAVCLVDSPGGQLSGTPTLYDLIRDPRKPTVSVVNEGLMASAAYWLACGSDFIYATQQTDQIGSIGVYVTFQDTREMNARLGIKTISIYSDRSSQKNKPYKDALDGDDSLMRDDLNQAADLFREAVEQGRGARLKPTAKNGPNVFEGGLFYAGKAIELGLIDGYGNLATAIDKVVELHNARQSKKSGAIVSPVANGQPAPGVVAAVQAAGLTAEDLTTVATTLATIATVEPVGTAELTENLSQTPTTDMFGFIQLAALAALKGVAAADVTDAQITALNAELTAAGFPVAAVSLSQFTAAQTLQADLNTANSTIAARDKEIERLGKQPGTMPSQTEKTEEKTGSTDAPNSFFSETDAELAKMKSGLN